MAPDREESDQAKGTVEAARKPAPERAVPDNFPLWSLWLAALALCADLLRYWSAGVFWPNIALGSLAGLIVLEAVSMIRPLIVGEGDRENPRGRTQTRWRGTVIALAAANLLLRLFWPSLENLPIGPVLSLGTVWFAARDMAAVLRARRQEPDTSDPPTGVY
jgi:hypothetical protein